MTLSISTRILAQDCRFTSPMPPIMSGTEMMDKLEMMWLKAAEGDL